MAGIIWPVDQVDGAPDYAARAWRQARGPLAGTAAGRPFGCRTGVWGDHDTTGVTATATTWTANPFGGAMDVEASNVEGWYGFSITDPADLTGSIGAANQTNQRVDSLFVVMSDPAAGDGSLAPSVAVEYVAGTPGASGGARGAAGGPPNFPARSFELRQIQVPKVGDGNPVVIDTAPRVVAVGGTMPLTSASDYPGNPHKGQVVWDPSVPAVYAYDGSNWRFPDGRKHGQTTITVGSGQTSNTLSITFNAAFPAAPWVFLTMDGGGLRMGVNTSSVTKTGFVLNCWTSDNRTLSSAQTVTVTWVAFPS